MSEANDDPDHIVLDVLPSESGGSDRDEHAAAEDAAHAAPPQPELVRLEDGSFSECTTSSLLGCGEQCTDTSKGVTLSWRNIKFSVDVSRMCGTMDRGKRKVILNDITGFVPPGRVMAIMGPSGCGKSTFLDVVAGRMAKHKGLTGQVFVNGRPRPRNFKGLIGYVMQDDSLIGSLTVRENLMFAAFLKLGSDFSFRDKIKRVDDTIEELGLTRVKDTKIGNVFYRGVSGGERRRVSIGMELILQPHILFLDEPTSGLDSKSSQMIIDLILKTTHDRCRTVLLTIHQPSSHIFHSLDGLMLLTKGELVYWGPTLQAESFFARAGHPLPAHVNPADYYLELINYDFQADKPERIAEIVAAYKNCSEHAGLLQRMDEMDANYVQNTVPLDEGKGSNKARKYRAGRPMQFLILCLRMFLASLRDPGVYWMRLAMYSVLAVMMGTLYLQIETDLAHIQDRISVLFFGVAFLSFMSISALPAFIEDRAVFVRERMNGAYSVLPYALAQMVVSIPFIILIALLFAAIAYWMILLHPGVEQFVLYVVLLALCLNVAESMVVAVSTIVPSFITGIALASCMFGGFMLLSGYFLLKINIPDYWIWAHYLSFQKYGFEAFMQNEFSGQQYPCNTFLANVTGSLLVDSFSNVTFSNVTVQTLLCQCSFPDLNNDCILSGEEILSFFQYEDVRIWAWILVLIGMMMFFRIIFYLFLRFLNKGKR